MPFVLHRPIPEDAKIKWVYLIRHRRGVRQEWSVQLVLARTAWTHADTIEARGVCGIDFGWRTLEDGSIRVAYVVGDDGYREELVLPPEKVSRWAHADSLQSIRDRELNLARERLVHWLAQEPDLPEWLREATATLPQWRSTARLAALAIRWRSQRWNGDEQGFEPLEAWRKQDRHLFDWEAAERVRAVRWRDDLYRRFAARLRWRYATAIVEDTDWRSLMSRPAAEEETMPELLNRRHIARIASPGRLRTILEASHPAVVRIKAAHTTQTCHFCGHVDEELDAMRRIVTCPACGGAADQDLRGAHNILRAASAQVIPA